MRFRILSTLLGLLACLQLSACAVPYGGGQTGAYGQPSGQYAAQGSNCGFPIKTTVGAVLGGAGGGALGSMVGHGTWNTVAIIGGTMLGAVVGGGVGQSLDNIDCMRASQATNYAVSQAPIGQQISWQNPQTGNYGNTQVLNRGYTQTGANCTQYRQSIFIQGRSQTATGIACQRQDGSWAIQPENG